MKNFILGIVCCFFIINANAQTSQAFSYQAVVRNSSGIIIQNQNVNMRISLLQGSTTGSIVFVEEHAATTNNFGLVNLQIGNGTLVAGSFTTIDWSAGPYFLQIEMDALGGNAYIVMGVSQLLSVPFALYAASGNPGPQGAQGVSGVNGQNGISVIWLGAFPVNPINPTINQAYYNSTDKKSYIFDGSAWQIIAQDGMQGLQGIQGTSGSNGQNGISVSWLGTFSANPLNPSINQAYYNSTDKTSYIFDGFGWQIIAQDGMQGLQGSSGSQGIQGVQGPAGTYVAGTGISITNDTISAVSIPYSAGTGLSLAGTTFNANFGSIAGTVSQGDHSHASYTVGGIHGNIQFNNNGAFGGSNALFWDNNNLWLGVGTSAPTSTLHVNGTLRITDDTEGAGRVLTSDTNGYASWQVPSNVAFSGTQNRIAKFSSSNSIGNSLLYENGNFIGLGTTNPAGRFVVKGDSLSNDSIPLFEVQDKNGNTVLVVWPDGVHIYVDASAAKSVNRGSFAVSGKSSVKSLANEYFSVNSDSIKASKSLYIPRMTTGERDSLPFTPNEALIIFNTSDKCMEIYENGVWSNIWCFNCAPAIIIQPTDKTICSETNTSFSVTLTGTNLMYQWQVSTNGGTVWSDILNAGVYSGAKSLTLSLTNVPVGYNGYQYRCNVSSYCPPGVTSNAVILNVRSTPPAISTPPTNQPLSNARTATFSIASVGYGSTYLWQESADGLSWSDIVNGGTAPNYSGAATSSLLLAGVPVLYNNYKFHCIVGNICGTSVTSNPVNLIISLPTLTTTAASGITSTSAFSGGNISLDGGATITERGICWSTSQNPTTADLYIANGSSTGPFTINITGLTPDVIYYVRAYAINSVGTAYGNQISFYAPLVNVGDSYQGGVVAYLLQSGDAGFVAGQTHGLIAAPSDQSTYIQWYNGTYTTTGATATAVGSGNSNTNTIVANQGAGGYAAKLCFDLVLGGYSDWYLPSRDELSKLFQNRVAIGGFSGGGFWSSSESNLSVALGVRFSDGIQMSYNKVSGYYVRAVRSF